MLCGNNKKDYFSRLVKIIKLIIILILNKNTNLVHFNYLKLEISLNEK